MSDEHFADLAEAARQGRAQILPSDPVGNAAPGSALESMERIAWGDLWQRGQLSTRERRLITLTCLALVGTNRTVGLHLRGALDSGDLSAEDLDAMTLQLAIYAGFPRGSAFNGVVQETLADRTDADGDGDGDG
jgi:alkylhydroperoxidase/carboxymuconolactone decarboxylase family protein YurZ